MRRLQRSALTFITTALLAFGQLVSGPAANAATATVTNQLSTTDLTNPSLTATSLAQTLVGSGVTVSNATYTGAQAQLGTIHIADPAVVSFNDGVIMSSGYVADVAGPNKSESTTGDMASQPGISAGAGDTDLTSLIAGSATVNPNTYDAATLSFDFVPTASTVYFTYVFGSDEYLEWVNLYNDVFAFYVTDATGKTTNCALTPANAPTPNQPVSIDTINSNVNTSLYRDNGFWTPPANPINIESDGLTVEMICQASVTPNATNHIKLAISDTSDQILDSVVMIKAHTLSTTPPESCNNGSDDNSNGLVDMDDNYCKTTTTPAPIGQPTGGGTGGSTLDPNFSNAPAFAGNEGDLILLDANQLGMTPNANTVYTTWTVTQINVPAGQTPATCSVQIAQQNLVTIGGVKHFAQNYAICPRDGEYKAWMHEWASALDSTNDNDIDFFVHNAPPQIYYTNLSTGDIVAPGVSTAFTASVFEPGDNDTFTCKIKWGDAPAATTVTPDVNGDCNTAHTYAFSGNYIIQVTATDNQGDSGALAIVVNVTDGLAQQTITFDSALPTSLTYGDTFTTSATTDSGLTLSYSSSGGCTNVGTTYTMKSGVTSCSVIVTAPGDSSFSPGQLTGSVIANKRAVTATADAKSKVWGDADPALTYKITSGSLASFDTALVGSLTRTAGEAVGPYAINAGTLTSANNPNYALTYVGANLTITGVAPVVLTNPVSTNVAVGATATFTASASGKPTPTVQWQVAAAGTSTFSNIVGATSTTYSFVTAASDNGKQYRAVFSNGVSPNATTTAATLSVGGAPTITAISPTSGAVGLSVTITGTNFSGVSSVVFSTGKAAKFIVVSPTQILTSVPTGAVTGVITVTTSQGSAKSATFTMKTGATVPTVTAYSVSATRPGNTVTVTLTGTNLTGITGANLNGVALSYSAVSATSATVVVPASGVTSGPIKVTTDGGTSANTLVFTVAPQPTSLVAGTSHSCALLVNATVKCWGLNTNGQLGDGTTTQKTSPTLVPGLTSVASIAAGGSTTCAVLTDGTAKCWGLNTNGQLGNGTTTQSTTPSVVKLNATTTLTGVSKITVGTAFACAAMTDGTAKCWGLNTNGQLGNGTTTQNTYPVTVSGLTGVTAISAGSTQACALLTSGAVKCWGQNTNGQLGNGSTTQATTPVAVTGIDGLAAKATAISTGTSFSCALITDGSVRCWGMNTSGQLGDGSTTQRTSPVTVKLSATSNLASVTALRSGATHSCVIVGSGATATAMCWGGGANGRLGNGGTANSSFAVAVSGTAITGVSALAAGGSFTLALVPSTTALSPRVGAGWGSNTNGQLGTGNTTAATSPVLMPAL